MSAASTVIGNTSKAIERHLSSSYQVVLYVAKNLDKITSNNNLMNHFAAFYLGGHTTPPTNTPSGDPLIAGGFYLNVNDNKLYFWAQVNGVFQWTDLNDVLVNVVTEFDAHAATVTTTFTELAEEYDTTFLTYLNDTQTYRNETDLMYQEILLMHTAVLQAYEHVLPLLNQIADIINQSSVYGGSIISDTPPNPPINSQRWTRCTDMRSFIWYADKDGGQWVEDNPSMGGEVPALFIQEAPPLNPKAGWMWLRCTDMKHFTFYVNAGHGAWIETNPSMGGTSVVSLPVFENDEEATLGGLVTDSLYKTITGEVRIKV